MIHQVLDKLGKASEQRSKIRYRPKQSGTKIVFNGFGYNCYRFYRLENKQEHTVYNFT